MDLFAVPAVTETRRRGNSPVRASLRLLALAVLFSGVFAAGCAKNATPPEWRLGVEGEALYYFLVQLEAAASGDADTFAEAGAKLLELTPDEASFLEMAEFSARRDRLEEARTTARKGLALFPASLPLTLVISDTYLQQEKNAEAADTLLHFIQTNPDNRDAEQELARVYLVGERYEEFDALLRTISAARMTPYLHYVKARSLLNRNRLAQGEKELRLVVAQAPDMIDAWVNLGIVLQLQDQHAASLPMFRKAVDADPENPGLWLRLIDAQVRAGRPGLAVRTLNEAPASPTLQIETAMLLVEAKRYDAARKIFQQVRDTPGAPEEVHIYLAALALENMNNPAEALRELAAIAPQSPLAERALRWRLQILENEGRAPETVPIARTYAEQNPEKAVFQIIYAQAASFAGDARTSVAVLRAAREKWPDDLTVAYALASRLEMDKQSDEAMRLMEFIVARDPDNASALNYVGYTLADANKDLERAHALISKAVAQAPDDPHIADSLAWVLYRMGDYGQAWEAIRKSISLGGDHPVIWEHYGDIARKVGKGEEARKGYANALKGKPENPEAIKTKMLEIQ